MQSKPCMLTLWWRTVQQLGQALEEWGGRECLVLGCTLGEGHCQQTHAPT